SQSRQVRVTVTVTVTRTWPLRPRVLSSPRREATCTSPVPAQRKLGRGAGSSRQTGPTDGRLRLALRPSFCSRATAPQRRDRDALAARSAGSARQALDQALRKNSSFAAVLSVTGQSGGSHESPARNAPRACSAAERTVAPGGRDRRALRPARGDRRDAAGSGVAQPGARLRGVVDRPSAPRATARVPQHRLEPLESG